MSVSASIPDTSLGLTSSEIQILRQQQQIALQNGHTGNGVSRGRGTGRTSNSSSRATSAASSHGRLLLDPMSLRALSHQLDGLQEQIRGRIGYVCMLHSCTPFFLFKMLHPPLCLLPHSLLTGLEGCLIAIAILLRTRMRSVT
jgi:hypothetical protein